MPKGHEIDEWMPLFITIWLTSPAIRAMTAEQRGWYIELLIRAWRNSEMPCHLRYDETRLWMQAGAKSREYFARHSALVIEQFVRMQREGSEWISQPDQLEIYNNQLSVHHSYKKRGKDGALKRWQKYTSAIAELKPSYTNACLDSSSVSDFEVGSKESKPPILPEVFLETFDFEAFVEKVREIYIPRGRDAQAAQMACCEAVEYEVEKHKQFGWHRSEAAGYILDRTQIAADLMRAQPKHQHQYWPTLYTFMQDHRYNDEYTVWEKSDGSKTTNGDADGALERIRARRASVATVQGVAGEVPEFQDR